MGTGGLLVDARDHPLTQVFLEAGMDAAAAASSMMSRFWTEDGGQHEFPAARAAAEEKKPERREPLDPKKLDAVLLRKVSKANDGRVIKVNYNLVKKERITIRTYSAGFPLCDCTSEYGKPAVSEFGELVPDVLTADALSIFAEPGALVFDDKQGGKDRERWLKRLGEAQNHFYTGSYADIGGNVEIKDWSGVPELTDDVFLCLHQVRWGPTKEDIRKLAVQGVVLERQRYDRYLFALVRDGEKAARILVGRKKRPKECEKKRVEQLLAAARKGRIPKGALHAGLSVAKYCLTMASVSASRTLENEDGAVLLADLLAWPEKMFVESAWARVKEWQSLRFGKFDEYKRVCAVARRHASDAATKLACRLWAKSGDKA